jgi:putative transposase
MLSDLAFSQWCERLQLSEAARRYIESVRKSDPARAVSSNSKGNVCSALASESMGLTINTESRTAEFAYAREFEFDDDVLEFWDQPQPVPVLRHGLSGPRSGTYTPDFLVLWKDTVAVIEIKRREHLPKLVENAPNDWKVEGASAEYRPATVAFSALPLPYRVLVAGPGQVLRGVNLVLLLRAKRCDEELTAAQRRAVAHAFEAQSCITLAELAKDLKLEDLTPLLRLIAAGELFARLETDELARPATAWLARRADFLSALPLPTTPTKFGQPDAGIEIATEACMGRLLRRLERLKGEIPDRTARRLKALVRQGEREGKPAPESLLPKFDRCGNRRSRLSAVQIDIANESIKRFLASSRRVSKSKAFQQYKVAAADRHPEYRAISWWSFLELIARFNPKEIAHGRGGRRTANSAAGPSPVESREPSPLRPFERACIDHCLAPLDIVIYERGEKRITHKAWITMMVDVATGYILAVWLSLNPPSCAADAMVVRRCIETFELFPEHVHTDRGSDFWSLYFRALLAFIGADHSLSPPASSRTNSTVERTFGHMLLEWVQQRPGNSVHGESPRGISGTHSPAATAELNIRDTWNELQLFVDWMNNRATDLSGKSAADKLREGLAQFKCSGIKVKMSPEFKISSAVDVRDYKVDSKDGIRVDDRRYSCAALADRRPAMGRMQVRIEPDNPYLVYAKINGAWHKCHASQFSRFENQDALEKLAEATQVLDGASFKREVRTQAQRDFIRTLNKCDEDRARQVDRKTSDVPKQLDLPTARNLFAEVRAESVDSLTEHTQEVPDHALDRLRNR